MNQSTNFPPLQLPLQAAIKAEPRSALEVTFKNGKLAYSRTEVRIASSNGSPTLSYGQHRDCSDISSPSNPADLIILAKTRLGPTLFKIHSALLYQRSSFYNQQLKEAPFEVLLLPDLPWRAFTTFFPFLRFVLYMGEPNYNATRFRQLWSNDDCLKLVYLFQIPEVTQEVVKARLGYLRVAGFAKRGLGEEYLGLFRELQGALGVLPEEDCGGFLELADVVVRGLDEGEYAEWFGGEKCDWLDEKFRMRFPMRM